MAEMEWKPIDSAPRDGRPIRTRRVVDGEVLFERAASWRTVTFPVFFSGGISVPAETITGWMYPDLDKRVPEPTHWLPSPPKE